MDEGGDTDSTDFSSGGVFSWIKEGLDSIVSGFKEGLGNIFNVVKDILSYINPFSDNFFGKKIIELLSDLLKTLFIPDKESFTAITDMVSEKLSFIDSIKIAVNSINDLISNSGTSPKITINIPESKYWNGGNVTIIDMSWYKPFKAYGDLILTGFMYVFFIWRVWINLPNTINGISSVGSSISINKGGRE